MQDVKVVQYKPSRKMQWDTFVSKSNCDTFLFYRDFMEYHKDRFKDYSLMFYKGQELMALLPLNKIGEKVYSHQGLTYGGLIYPYTLKTEEIIGLLKAVLEFLYEKNCATLFIKALPYFFLKNPTNNPLSYLSFKTKATLKRMDMHSVLDLKYKRYSKSRRAGIKRGEKHDLIVEETDDFTSFWNHILIPNLKNKHAVTPVHRLDEMTYLKSIFPNQIRQFNVYHSGKIVAGTTIFETETVAHSQYISGNTEKNTLGSLDFLHHYLLEAVFADKLFFNFGISNTQEGQYINQGLLYWKEGFGARSVTQGFYEIPTKNYKLLEDVMV